MENWKKALLAGTALVGTGLLGGQAFAQSGPGTFVTQTTNRPDSGIGYAGVTSAICTGTQQSTANLTLTMTPPAGQYVYLQSFVASVAPNATGAASTAAYTSTNLTGGPTWLIAEQASAAGTPQVLSSPQIADFYPTGLKSQSAGTAVTLVPTATMASASVCPHATYWVGP
jgi:hypothetical protein